MELTSISQSDVNNASYFPKAFKSFIKWCDAFQPYTLVSWGDFDPEQLERDCTLHNVEWRRPNCLDLKEQFASAHQIRPCGMIRALKRAGLEHTGPQHRSLEDARNTAKLLDHLERRNMVPLGSN